MRTIRRPLPTIVLQVEAPPLAGKGKSHAEINRMLRVSRSTITRFLAKARSARGDLDPN